ncbi:hypothetical protein BpHYR1_047267 [Brachionus plicatilis]|uniref:Uncharacterized protein n=1 Tax=Brachionus plicatilis TaxID=10195 RepID=A0A3M7T566_BRAPC|nr:hypothetical protein BpHYR1_047267 [Brachionus plicatilis]
MSEYTIPIFFTDKKLNIFPTNSRQLLFIIYLKLVVKLINHSFNLIQLSHYNILFAKSAENFKKSNNLLTFWRKFMDLRFKNLKN